MNKRTRLTILAGTTAAVVLGTAGIAAACGRGGRSSGQPKAPTTTILTIPTTAPATVAPTVPTTAAAATGGF